MNSQHITRQIGPYSRPHRLASIDGRTKEAALMRHTRAALIAHVGQPSAVQAALIERAVWLTLGCAQLDRKLANGVAFTQHDHNSYISWSNALSRTLRALGLKEPAASPADQMDQQELLRRIVERHRRTGAAA
jgi:hypothetical protein